MSLETSSTTLNSFDKLLYDARYNLEIFLRDIQSNEQFSLNIFDEMQKCCGFMLFSLDKTSKKENNPIGNGIFIAHCNNTWATPIIVNFYISSETLFQSISTNQTEQSSNKINLLLLFNHADAFDHFIKNEELTIEKDFQLSDINSSSKNLLLYSLQSPNGQLMHNLSEFNNMKIAIDKPLNEEHYDCFSLLRVLTGDIKMLPNKDYNYIIDLIERKRSEKHFDTTGHKREEKGISMNKINDTIQDVKEKTQELIDNVKNKFSNQKTQIASPDNFGISRCSVAYETIPEDKRHTPMFNKPYDVKKDEEDEEDEENQENQENAKDWKESAIDKITNIKDIAIEKVQGLKTTIQHALDSNNSEVKKDNELNNNNDTVSVNNENNIPESKDEISNNSNNSNNNNNKLNNLKESVINVINNIKDKTIETKDNIMERIQTTGMPSSSLNDLNNHNIKQDQNQEINDDVYKNKDILNEQTEK